MLAASHVAYAWEYRSGLIKPQPSFLRSGHLIQGDGTVGGVFARGTLCCAKDVGTDGPCSHLRPVISVVSLWTRFSWKFFMKVLPHFEVSAPFWKALLLVVLSFWCIFMCRWVPSVADLGFPFGFNFLVLLTFCGCF